MKSKLTLLSIAVLGLPALAWAQEAKQPNSWTLHARLTKEEVTVESTSAAVDPVAAPTEGEIWIQCREIKLCAATSGKADVECRGDVKVLGRWRRRFEAHADHMVIRGTGRRLEFRGAGSHNVDLWLADADGTSRKHLTDRRITWKIADEPDADDLGFFHDYSDDGAARKPIALPHFLRSE